MKLPALTIDSFRQSCHEDTERIWRFMDRKTPTELRADHSIRGLQILRGTLQLHWGQMNEAWRTHNPADGNVDVRVLAQLDAIVEAQPRFGFELECRAITGKLAHIQLERAPQWWIRLLNKYIQK